MTGTSVIAIKFKDGVVVASDNLGLFTTNTAIFSLLHFSPLTKGSTFLASYGSLARFADIRRLRTFDNSSVIGFGGDVSDMQYLDRLLQSLDIRENFYYSSSSTSSSSTTSSQHTLNAKNLHTYLSKILYKRRSEFNPLWNNILVAGFDDDGSPFLSFADLLGTTFSGPSLATGFGAHLAQPLLRRLLPQDEASVREITRETAVNAVKECMKVLFYRDARSIDRYSIAIVTKEGGVEMKEDEKLEGQSWAFADMIRGYGTQTN